MFAANVFSAIILWSIVIASLTSKEEKQLSLNDEEFNEFGLSAETERRISRGINLMCNAVFIFLATAASFNVIHFANCQ